MVPVDPSSLAFLIAETRNQPMHVGGLQLFEPSADGPESPARAMYEQAMAEPDPAPLFKRRPLRSIATAGQWMWTEDRQFDIEHHVRHNALPEPGRVRELLELVSRLHGTSLSRERPLWEAHIVEGLRDGRLALYTKMHHALVDGVSAMRLMQSMLTTDPGERDMPMPWTGRPTARERRAAEAAESRLAGVPVEAMRTALGITADAAGMPAAIVRTLTRGIRNETGALSLYAPRTMFNVSITSSRRFAAQDWPLDRIRAIAKASGTTLNDVVLAMCSGAVRAYLLEHDALPESTLVSMVPVGLRAKESQLASADGGNAVGAVMVRLGTDLADPAERLRSIHHSMRVGKQGLASMTPNQILGMSAVGMAPSIVTPMLHLHGIVRPPFNLIISNVPGPRKPQYYNGAKLVGAYPASIPIQGMALNITCTSYAEMMCFGLTGCRRSVPHLQRLLTHLDAEIGALESATGVN